MVYCMLIEGEVYAMSQNEVPTADESKRGSFAQRSWTAVLLCAFLTAALYLGSWFFAVAAFIAITLTLYEELRALRDGSHHPVCWTSYASLAMSVPLIMFYSSLAIIPTMALLCFCVVLQVMRRETPDLIDILVSVLPMLTIVLPGMFLIGLLDTQPLVLQKMLLITVFAVAIAGDTFAYLVGSTVGGPKLCPRISPKKTVSGAVGGLLGSMLAAVVVGRLCSLAAVDCATYPSVWGDLAVGFFGGVASQVGDLFASMVKRHCGVKDFGTLFPGHGGMLDRMDSIYFSCIIVYCYRAVLLTLA